MLHTWAEQSFLNNHFILLITKGPTALFSYSWYIDITRFFWLASLQNLILLTLLLPSICFALTCIHIWIWGRMSPDTLSTHEPTQKASGDADQWPGILQLWSLCWCRQAMIVSLSIHSVSLITLSQWYCLHSALNATFAVAIHQNSHIYFSLAWCLHFKETCSLPNCLMAPVSRWGPTTQAQLTLPRLQDHWVLG